MDEWQPIETAPEDGFFLVYEDGAVRTMLRDGGIWSSPGVPVKVGFYGDWELAEGVVISDCIYEPTHWMPCPRPPDTAPREWQAVPVEPTAAMIEAADELCPIARGTESHAMAGGVVPEEVWRAMLRAAPSAPLVYPFGVSAPENPQKT